MQKHHQKRRQVTGRGYKAQSLVAQRSYPKSARRKGKEGTVRVRFSLSRDGRISNPHIVTSRGNKALDCASIKALKRLGKYKNHHLVILAA